MDKKQLRIDYKLRRSNLSISDKDIMSSQIAQRLSEKFDLDNKQISIFLPIEKFNEIDCWKIIDSIDAQFILPVVNNNVELIHIKYESKNQLVVSDWGIPEPTFGEQVDVENIEIVLVPLLIFDNFGFRVGYGKGFYDQFLKACSSTCIFIGLSYFEPINQISDIHDADVSLHFCVTPNKVYSF